MTTAPKVLDQPAVPNHDEPDPLTQRAIGTTFDFARAIVSDPAFLDDIPDGVTLVLIPDDDAELAAAEIEQGIAAVRRGEDVYFRHLGRGDHVR